MSMPWDKRAIELEPTEGHYANYIAWKEWFAEWQAKQHFGIELDIDESESVLLYAAFCAACSTPRDHEGNATAILARLAHANIIFERYDASKPDDYPEWLAGFESWLRNRYASLVFAYNDSGMGIHKRLVDEVKEIMEKLHAAMPNSYVERSESRGTEHEFQPLLLKCQTIRKLAYEAKSIAAEIVGASAQQELMEIERLADVVVARILDESGASCDRSLFDGNAERCGACSQRVSRRRKGNPA